MARRARSQTKLPIETYEHRDKERVNNPPVGLVMPEAGYRGTESPQLIST